MQAKNFLLIKRSGTMHIKKLVLFLSLLIIYPLTAVYSQDENVQQNYNTIGLTASSISGTGLSYSRFFGPKFATKISGIYYEHRDETKSDTNPEDKDFNKTIWWNAGLELQWNFYYVKIKRVAFQFYTLAGGSYWYSEIERPFEPEDNKTRKHYTAGAGAGARFIIADRCSINAELGYQYSDWLDFDQKYVGIGGGIGVNLHF